MISKNSNIGYRTFCGSCINYKIEDSEEPCCSCIHEVNGYIGFVEFKRKINNIELKQIPTGLPLKNGIELKNINLYCVSQYVCGHLLKWQQETSKLRVFFACLASALSSRLDCYQCLLNWQLPSYAAFISSVLLFYTLFCFNGIVPLPNYLCEKRSHI